ncbi:MLO-like protein 6 [Mucuna pruriens]|uniref:MLO-like protein n=1 Tax=Mucuna pruriens TaxID=157652 RepID=A0A371F2K4_MUCPR|nr:MLO-like protein 6 [Mucuna pruriens]
MGEVLQMKLEQTPTWAVAVVCFVILAISMFIEHSIEALGKWLKKKHKKALHEALEKVKGELMLMGFISFLLVAFQDFISSLICIPKHVASTWHPCKAKDASKGKVAFVSEYGIHQLHVFIFVLAIFHILQCIITLTLGRTKMSRWRAWEDETKTIEYQFYHDPERFRFARDTTFGRRHLSSWSRSPISLWIVSFFRQFYGPVSKVDYMALRHGFVVAHLTPASEANFDFRNYIKRTLDEDFAVVVGISPTIWFFAVLSLLTNTQGWYAYLWLPFIPLIIILLVGTKLQMIITEMALRIQDRGQVVKGEPVVEPGDELFWFNRPRLILSLIHIVNFMIYFPMIEPSVKLKHSIACLLKIIMSGSVLQNAFQLAFFAWSSFDNGFKINTCFHKTTANIAIRLTIGVLTQVLCSYVTLPLYALVTQMGSSMKPTIFNDNVAAALKNWHQGARKHIKHKASGHSESNTPFSSRPGTPPHGMSPVHLLHKHPRHSDSPLTTPRAYNYENEQWHLEGSPSPSHHAKDHDDTIPMQMQMQMQPPTTEFLPAGLQPIRTQQEINIALSEFSFGRGHPSNNTEL